jgi:hypothetical protein
MSGHFWKNMLISASILGLLGTMAGCTPTYGRQKQDNIDFMTRDDHAYYDLWSNTTIFLDTHPYSGEQAKIDTEKLRVHQEDALSKLHETYPESTFFETPMPQQAAESLYLRMKPEAAEELGLQEWYDSCVLFEYGTEHAKSILKQDSRDSLGTIEGIITEDNPGFLTGSCRNGSWKILLLEQPIYKVWVDMSHEDFHARRQQVNRPEPRYDDRLEETEASLFSWEILARLALEGSVEADYVLANQLWIGADYYIMDPMVPDWDYQLLRDGAYLVLPYRGVIEMLHENRSQVSDYLPAVHGDFALDALKEYLQVKVGIQQEQQALPP